MPHTTHVSTRAVTFNPPPPPHTHAQALITLLDLAFDPATEAGPQFRQTLTVALETLASLSLQAQSLLASALLPAARRWV